MQPAHVTMDGFTRDSYPIFGVETVVYSIGHGPTVVFLHGAGTFTGFDAVRALADHHTVLVPYHPGFGESGDDASMVSIDDYVIHYAELFDRLGLAAIDLIGFSLGGWIAAQFAVFYPVRVRRLVLVAPAGLVVPEHPAPDLFQLPPSDLPAWLAHDPEVALRYFPSEPDPAFAALAGREMGALTRLLAPGPQGDIKLARRLSRITMPTLLLWGGADRLRPTAQAATWTAMIPTARLHTVPHAGHLLYEENPAAMAVTQAFLAEA